MTYRRRKLAVIGDPIAHSLSPQMHNPALKYLKLDLQYSAVQVKVEEIADFVEEAKKNYLGFNITVPHKNKIIPYLDEISPVAKYGNSVNTVKIDEHGKAIGHSTDGYGLEMALSELFGVKPSGENFLFIGCGGAAQATSVHLLDAGAHSVTFINRSLDKAERFISNLQRYKRNADLKVFSFDDDKNIKLTLERKPVIIQSTSIGLKRNDPLLLDEKYFIKDLCYYDMIYNDTQFLRCAKKNGCRYGNGVLMLLYQGAKSFSIWTGREAPVDVMKKSLVEAMQKNK